MEKTSVEQAVIELEELHPIEQYYDTIRMIKENDVDEMRLEAFAVLDYRSDLLQVLIEAKKLTGLELGKIKKIDDFILASEVHPLLQPLKDWLKTHSL